MTSALYHTLDVQRQEIRLLEILPDANIDAPLRCHMRTASLANPPPPSYCALSYVWGDATKNSEIWINGVGTLITTSLAGALRRIRSPLQPVIIWADAVCINQSDLLERSRQVGMMASIYSAADHVIVWLGEEADDSSLAFDTMEKWERWAQDKTDAKDIDLQAMENDIPAAFDPRRAGAVVDLAERNYWTRTWIMQELILAKRAIVFCGRNQLDFHSFILARWAWQQVAELHMKHREDEGERMPYLMRFLTTGMANMISSHGQYCTEPHNKLKRIANPTADCWIEKGALRFGLEFLNSFRQNKATDPRDKIYGLLGILPPGTASVVPDYTKPVSQVFCEVTRLLITNDQNLRILAYAGRNDDNPADALSIPSWVPNWALSRHNHDLTDHGVLRNDQGLRQPGEEFSKTVRFSDDGRTLRASGRILDTVTSLYAKVFPFESDDVDEFIKNILDAPATHGLPSLQTFFRTASFDCDQMFKSGKLNSQQKEYNWNAALFLRILANEISKHKHAVGPESMEEFLVKRFLGEQADEPRASELLALVTSNNPRMAGFLATFQLLLRLSLIGKTHFRTKRGSEGFGPSGIMAGDMILHLVGHNFPFCLRKMPGHSILIGECFLLDMDTLFCTGELADLEEFDIC